MAEAVTEPIAAEQAVAEVEEAAIEPIAAEQAVAPVEEAATEIEAELEAPVPEGVLEDAVQVEEATEEEPAEGVLVEEPAPIDLPEILIPELDELVPERRRPSSPLPFRTFQKTCGRSGGTRRRSRG